MPQNAVVVVATMTAKPESVDAVRDACTAAIEEVMASPAASCTRCTKPATPSCSSSSGPTRRRSRRTAPPAIGKLFGAVGEHLDGAPDIKLKPIVAGDPARVSCAAEMGALTGGTAFITGAARGQGRAHAPETRPEGADIIAVDLCDQIASVPHPMATPTTLAATVKLVEGPASGSSRRSGARCAANGIH